MRLFYLIIVTLLILAFGVLEVASQRSSLYVDLYPDPAASVPSHGR